MDRLPALIVLVAVVGCTDTQSGAPKKDNGRVAAVEAAEAKDPAKAAAAWCDVMHEPDAAKPFAYPTLASGAGVAGPHAPSGLGGRARWVNVWATWCKPCIDELPRIEKFREKLGQDGAQVELQLLAADGPDEFDAFVAENAAAKGSLRLADPDGLSAWVGSLGLEADAGLPLHLFVDGENRLRCARLGGVENDHYADVLAVARSL
jgi:thiol-disulfide isomerase/thioredoxin